MNPPPPGSLASATSRLRSVTPGGSRYDFLLSLPDGYERDTQRRWPLLVFLHGAAERGADIWAVTKQGPPRLLHGGPDLSPGEREAEKVLRREFIVVAPQCPHFEVWDDGAIEELIERVDGELRVDPDRVYLTGLSMGGFGTWSHALRHPHRLAAAAPVCGGGRLADIEAAYRDNAAALQALAFWAFHGDNDRVVPPDESQRMVARLHALGHPEAKLTLYPESGHDAWTAAYGAPELYRWLLQHRRPAGH